MGTMQLKSTSFWFLFLTTFFLSSCLMRATPPGPNSASGSIEGVSYTFHQWAQGLSVMIWHNLLPGTSSCGGSGSTSDPIYREECTVEDADGRSLEWQIHTTDGVTAEMWINGTEYNLANGRLFLIEYQNDTPQIVQLQDNLANLAANDESITAFAQANQDISNFIESVKSRSSE
jgi:hypothetical protein